MSRAISFVVIGALFSALQGSASADEQSINDQCRAKIRTQIKGPVCQKSQVDQLSDPCYISAREAMQSGLQDRIDLCVDRAKVRRWNVAV
ncbi:hypothetical protein [Afipia sp. GAS231]|uniref:hypothetical protein n=1 Tax=Afipia sp. GAS231 TaxID=1882747 RepID=UPI0012F745CB|nr:hypothetical protein [Afipia sp. GAS231]